MIDLTHFNACENDSEIIETAHKHPTQKKVEEVKE
jgi:hypothetical protein